jgi:hypothetical protein
VSKEQFEKTVSGITARLSGRPLNADLQAFLTEEFPPAGDTFQSLADLCRLGIRDGWLCDREHAGIRFGRIVPPGPASHGFSVDVVAMEDCVGPYHRHPTGEIDMIIPAAAGAKFDGHGRGWLVYEPGSAHAPTVTKGRAIILYLLPGGQIDFTRPVAQ